MCAVTLCRPPVHSSQPPPGAATSPFPLSPALHQPPRRRCVTAPALQPRSSAEAPLRTGAGVSAKECRRLGLQASRRRPTPPAATKLQDRATDPSADLPHVGVCAPLLLPQPAAHCAAAARRTPRCPLVTQQVRHCSGIARSHAAAAGPGPVRTATHAIRQAATTLANYRWLGMHQGRAASRPLHAQAQIRRPARHFSHSSPLLQRSSLSSCASLRRPAPPSPRTGGADVALAPPNALLTRGPLLQHP